MAAFLDMVRVVPEPMDILFVAVTLLFFALSAWLVSALDRL
ncbi:hypothetical protein [Candidatus Nitrospira bockiana]